MHQLQSSEKEKLGQLLLILGIVFNVGLLGYFKYSNFFIETLNGIFKTSIFIPEIILPLGISFYTFQQIAYLVDSLEGESKEYRFLDYCLFVCFFPKIMAGPIVTHQEMIPQFAKRSNFRFNQEALS
ncbi:MAG: MBOAT family protein, partial [Microcystaceae cyanobacterium]